MTPVIDKENIVKENEFLKDYSCMQQEGLIKELESLIKTQAVENIRKEVNEVKRCFDAKIDKDKNKKRQEYIENGGEEKDFHYDSTNLNKFNEVYKTYKEKINKYYKQVAIENKKNIAIKHEVLKELKALSEQKPPINKSFFDTLYGLKDRWRDTGRITDVKTSDDLWQNYKHYLDVLNNYLKLSNEFRDIDVKYNLEQRLKIVERAKLLLQEPDIRKRMEELEILKRIWDEVGFIPNKQGRESWEEFRQISKQIYDKKKEQIVLLNKEYKINLEIKRALCDEIEQLLEGLDDIKVYAVWKEKSINFDNIVEKFSQTGIVPRSAKKDILDRFMGAKRTFIKKRNTFYKYYNQDVTNKLKDYKILLNQVDELKESNHWDIASMKIKEIQRIWKLKGVIKSKKYYELKSKLDKKCDYFFERYRNRFSENIELYQENIEHRKALLNEIENLTPKGDREKDITLIIGYIHKWKNMGEVLPNEKVIIEERFSNLLLSYANKINLSMEELENIQFEAQVKNVVEKNDMRYLKNMLLSIQNNVTELKKEIRQLENNLGFFVHSKSNPFKNEIQAKIERLSCKLKLYEYRLNYLKKVKI